MYRKNFIIDFLLEAADFDIPLIPLESPYDWLKRKKNKALQRKRYQEQIWKLKKRKFLEIVEKNGKKFIKLTAHGELEKLLVGSVMPLPQPWDGKWRVLIFDIPESSRHLRDQFRLLLKHNGFVKLQASVFICPYALNRYAIEYLNRSGLDEYIKILRVDEINDERILLKKFNLTRSPNSRP